MKELNDHELLEQLSKQLKEQQRLLDELARRLSAIEYNNWMHTPLQPKKYNQCSKCGLDLNGTLAYCCSNIDCPTGLGPVRC